MENKSAQEVKFPRLARAKNSRASSTPGRVDIHFPEVGGEFRTADLPLPHPLSPRATAICRWRRYFSVLPCRRVRAVASTSAVTGSSTRRATTPVGQASASSSWSFVRDKRPERCDGEESGTREREEGGREKRERERERIIVKK